MKRARHDRPVRLAVLLILLTIAFGASARAGEPYWIETAESTQHYRIEPLSEYAFVYSDRDFVFTAVPRCLDGATYVRTANADKFTRGAAFLTLRSEVPLVVYLGYDRRYRTRPEWLRRQFRPKPGLELTMGDPKLGKSQVTYELHRAELPAGRIVLGGNLADDEKSNYAMYTAVIVEASRDRCR